MNTLWISDVVSMLPINGPVMYTPMANPRSVPMNQVLITLGEPMDTSGPPSPSTATASNRVVWSIATARRTIDDVRRPTQSSNAQRGPMRSSRMPAGSAAAT